MSKIVTLLTCLFITAAVSAQTTGSVKGKLIDTLNKQSLKDASVTVLDARDSTVEVFTLAKQDGSFSLQNISFGDMILQIKFQGYEPYSKTINFSRTNASVDLGTIYLKTASNDLGNVTVTESVIRMKKDTMEVSASAFKTKPNAVAEDLLKKIPGMEVAKDGSIKSQGEAVQRVLVNGKRFFGDDPKLATKTLPPDVIDKIQVFDDLSDQSKFSGFDDGNRVKTINITTKKETRKGMFGKAVAGIGSDGRYDESFNFQHQNGDRQLSFLGQANDINKQNFQQNNIGGGRGGGGGGGGGNAGAGGGSGITSTLAGGINYRDAWSPKIDAYGSYFYNQPKVNTEQSSRTENILNSDSSNYNNSVSSSVSRSENHRINFNFEDRIDSSNSLIFRPNFTIQSSNPNSASTNITTGGKNNTPINQSVTQNSSYNSGYTLNNTNLQIRHRFAKRGRTLSLDMGISASQNNGDGKTLSVNSFYKPFVRTDTLNQYYVDSSKSFGFNPTVSYTEPIAKNQMLEFRYSLNYQNSSSATRTYRFDNASQKFSTFDSLFSNAYKYTNTSNTANITYRLQQTKYNMSVGTGLQFQDINSDNTTKNVIVKRNFVNFTPNLNFTYNFTRTKSLRIFYNGRTGTPSTSQLQPIRTTSDSINFQVGNPNLTPSFNNNLRILFNSFDPFTQRLIFATINGSITGNDIVSSIIQNPNGNGGRTTTYVNLGTTYNLSGYFMYGFPIKSPKSNLNLQTNVNYANGRSLLNGVNNATTSTVFGETIKWTTNLKNNFDMNLSTSFSVNPIRNSLSTTQNTNYTTQSLAADFTLYSNNGWLMASDFDYTHYGNRPAGYNTTVFLITPSIAKQFLKNKAGELRLSCFDLLNQNKAVTSSASANQIVNSISNNLTRYFMLTFTYNLRSFGGQQQRNQQNQMRGMFPGGMDMHGGGGNFGGGRRGGGI
ncbi:MAG: outer membrane beta-barrel family protein [Bacteroidota bacterium]